MMKCFVFVRNGNKESITGADKQLTNSMSSLAGLPSLGLNDSKGGIFTHILNVASTFDFE